MPKKPAIKPSFNPSRFEDALIESHYPSLWKATGRAIKSLLKKALRKQFSKTDTILKPVTVKVWNGGTDALD